MEPLDEPILRVNRDKTALVLGGSVPSDIPPDSLIGDQRGFSPLHKDTVKSLASILAPALCPSALSSKFRVGVLLCGLAGEYCVSDHQLFSRNAINDEPVDALFCN